MDGIDDSIDTARLFGPASLVEESIREPRDLREPFIDGSGGRCLSRSGVVRIELDDLLIEGMVDASDSRPDAAEIANRMPTTPEEIQSRLQDRLYDLQRGIPHWLQYRGKDWSG